MYQQPNANNVPQLPFPEQRKILLSYFTCNYWIYIVYCALNVVCVVNLLSFGSNVRAIAPNFIYAIWFFTGASNNQFVRKGLMTEYNISGARFRNKMKEAMRWHWYLIITQCLAAGLLSAFLIWNSQGTPDFGWNLKLSGIMVGGVLINLIPFFIQVSRHRTINQAIEEIGTGGGGVAADQASFTNQAPQPQVQVQPQAGAGYGYGQQQTQPQPSYGQQPAKPYGQPQPQPGYAQQPAKGYDNNLQNGGYR